MTENLNISLPKEWGEVSPFLFFKYLAAKGRGIEAARVVIWRAYDNETYRATQKMAPEAATAITCEVLEALAWMDTPPTFSIIEKFGRRRFFNLSGSDTLYFSDDKMQFSTVREFILADEVYTKIFKATEDRDFKAVAQLSKTLLAIVARPLKKDRIQQFFKTGERRELILSLKHAEHLAQKITTPHIDIYAHQAIIYFTGVKEYIFSAYGSHLFDSKENQTQRVNLKWHGHVMAVAETGTFGNFEAVYNENLHVFLLYLIKRKQDGEANTPAPSS